MTEQGGTLGARRVLDAYGHRPYWRGRLHLLAALLAVPAAALLMVTRQTPTARVAAAVFGASLVGLYTVSATYHRAARTPAAVLWFRRLDHSMIFVLIAGTYTPVCLLALPPAWGIPLLVVVWSTALTGIVLKLTRLGDGRSSDASWLYGVLGWAGVLTLPALIGNLGGTVLALLAVGGVIYTVGALGLRRRWPNPAPDTFGYHEVWHSLTIVAAGCHFAAVALLR